MVLLRQIRSAIINNNGQLFTYRCASGLGMAENQINEWLRNRGDQQIQNKGKKLLSDRHNELATSLGLQNDYVHSKILADNNIKPESIERRIKLDKQWDQLKLQIRDSYLKERERASLTVEQFVHQNKSHFAPQIEDLDAQAKKVNQAGISDSLRFNGRSPVRHAKSFKLEERMLEALTDEESKN